MIHRNPSPRPGVLAFLSIALGIAVLVVPALFPGSQARAQAIIATVNGGPITDIDVDQRMKLLRVLHQPAGRDAALESLIDDQLMLQETKKYELTASDTEIGQEIARTANGMKMAPEALMIAMQAAGISDSHVKDHFGALFRFSVLVQAYNKGVEASETQVRAELAKDGGMAAAGVDYTVRQVIFTVFASDSPATAAAKMKAAEELRSRFDDCSSGLALARSISDVAIKQEIRRNSLQLSDSLRELLDKTPVGHLTAPARTSEGFEMIAVCSKQASNDDSALRNEISEKLMAAEIKADEARRLKELRSYAVVVMRK